MHDRMGSSCMSECRCRELLPVALISTQECRATMKYTGLARTILVYVFTVCIQIISRIIFMDLGISGVHMRFRPPLII